MWCFGVSHKIDVAFTGTGSKRHKARQPSMKRWPQNIRSTRPLSFTPVFEFIQTCINPLYSCRNCTWKKKKAEVVSDRLTFHHLGYLNPNRLKHFAKPKDNGLPIDLCSVQMFSCVCAKMYTADCLTQPPTSFSCRHTQTQSMKYNKSSLKSTQRDILWYL